MPATIRIWLELAHHAAFRVGGWAFVRVDAAGQVSGTAAGERRLDPGRAALLALRAALQGLPPGVPAELSTASAAVLAIPRRLAAAEAGQDPPGEDLDLWAQAATALRSGQVALRRAEPAPGSPAVFAAAWAELARDRAKDKGAFSAAIPKPNLAKAGV